MYKNLLDQIFAASMEKKNPFIKVKYCSEIKLLKTGRESEESPNDPIIYKLSDFQVMIGDSFIKMLQNKEIKIIGEI